MISGTGVPFQFLHRLGSFLEALRAIWQFCVHHRRSTAQVEKPHLLDPFAAIRQRRGRWPT
jgi:hypothetical protein